MTTHTTLHKLARGLGWFSIALGTAELLRPAPAARLTGMRSQPRLIRAFGAREIVTGAGLLLARNPAPWLWARVAGDVLDVAAVGYDARDTFQRRRVPARTGVTLGALAGVLLVDLLSAQAATRHTRRQCAATRYDYSDRSGWPAPPEQMRGLAAQTPAASSAQSPFMSESSVNS
ncbi:transcriptional regulator [Aquabacterium olei]|uniref:Transcriptional regulator n=1 Tax=Aquabacterium olei TaxID=1296669 RepID=A0A2U8FQ54_9BURK|nr:transcriptional regulator [Aquabacterium olei]AWI53100.1 transcriptional regulator [Aquabacterium olei]